MNCRIFKLSLYLGHEDLNLFIAPAQDAREQAGRVGLDDLEFLKSLEASNLLELGVLGPRTDRDLEECQWFLSFFLSLGKC